MSTFTKAIFLVLGFTSIARSEPVSFNRDVRPILSNNCFRCHGPDEADRKAKMRLDVPGEVDLEEVVARITSMDADDIMPPPESNKSLTQTQIATLKQWIAEGAKYEKHWAFVQPNKPEIPDGKKALDHLNPATSKPATPLALVRRTYLDLIGLPPTPRQADAFANDPSPDAYEKLIDQLLASPSYGERWARRWLDLARYADTNGYEKDRDRSIWPYRDWVVRALNADMPFDQFTIEQLAGDMLPNATEDQRIATGFHRNTMLNEEGGIDPLEFRFHSITDRVATTGTTWLGLTTGCAQCHTHKFDPITHTDYFGMMAYLNNADEPDLILRDVENKKKQTERLAKADRLTAKLADQWPTENETQDARKLAETAFEKWLEDEQKKLVNWHSLIPTSASANYPYLTHEGDGVIFAGGDISKHDIYTLELAPQPQETHSIRLEALPDDRLPDRGPGMTYYEGRKGDFYLTEFKITGSKIASAFESYSKNRFGNGEVTAKLATDGDIQTGWSVAGKTGQRHVAIFILEKPIPANQPIQLEMHFGRHYASSLGKFKLSASPEKSESTGHDLAVEQLLAKKQLNENERATLFDHFLLKSPKLAEPSKQINDLRNRSTGTTTLVMSERPADHPRATRLHHRGEFLSPKQVVQPRLPDAIFPAGNDYPQDRLEFARWLVAGENPLTARVVVNRHWATLFGTGIVKSLDDFGMQGALPSNQPLLDYLANSLVENGWSIKKLHRQILLSQAYQQESNSRTRLDAEVIRDSSLSIAGLLSKKMFGTPVRPPQPGGVTEVAYGKPKWKPSEGEDRYRRSLYTYQKRTAPFAMFTTFDGGSGEACIARRDRSNTPLQALTLMNDPMFIEIAEAFGKTIAAGDGNDQQKIHSAFRRTLTRPPNESELAQLVSFHTEHKNWTALARVLLSLDETITKP